MRIDAVSLSRARLPKAGPAKQYSTRAAWPRRSRAWRRRPPLHPKSSILALLILLHFALGVHDAGAFRGWCRADPQFMIDGQVALVTVAAGVHDMRAARELSTGPIGIVLTVPRSSDVRLLASGNGFGLGYDISIEQSLDDPLSGQTIPVRVDVYVPMTDSTVPVRVSFAPAGQSHLARIDGDVVGRGVLTSGAASGTANAWISIAT